MRECKIELFQTSYVVVLPSKGNDPKDGCFLPEENWQGQILNLEGVAGVGGPNITGSLFIEFVGKPSDGLLQECLYIINDSVKLCNNQ